MDASNYMTIGLGVATILASGLTSSVVTYRLNRRKDQAEFMRTKAEALYLAAEEYGRTLAKYTLPHYSVVKGEITWNDMLDMHIKSGSEKPEHGGHESMKMLVDIYFPSVRPALSSVFDARREFNTMAFDMKRAYKDSGRLDRSHWMPRMNDGTGAINAAIKQLEEAIVEAARSYAGVRQQ